MIVAKYQTIGTEVPDPDYPALNCGYDNIETGFLIVPDEETLGDLYEPETFRSLTVVAEQPTLGL